MQSEHMDILKKMTGRFASKSLLIVGDLMLDRYLWGNVSRISPEAPVPVVQLTGESARLGGAANVAHNAVALGATAAVVGMVGTDEAGVYLLSEMKKRGITCDAVFADSSRPTTVKTRIIAHNQQVVRADRESRTDAGPEFEDGILSSVRRHLETSHGVIISDYGKGVLTDRVLKSVIAEVRAHDIPVCVDPKETRLLSYVGVTVITPNQHEAGFAYGRRIVDDATLAEVGWGLRKGLKSDGVLITRGEKGMSLFEKSGEYTHFPTVAREVYDVTGAGDTVVTAFALAVASGASLKQAASISNHAAGIVIRELGTATVTPEELVASFEENKQWNGW